MADITMCLTKECPNEKTCYRKTAKANTYRQSVACFGSVSEDKKSVECDYYWEVILTS